MRNPYLVPNGKKTKKKFKTGFNTRRRKDNSSQVVIILRIAYRDEELLFPFPQSSQQMLFLPFCTGYLATNIHELYIAGIARRMFAGTQFRVATTRKAVPRDHIKS